MQNSNTVSETRNRDKITALNRMYPGQGCGNRECERLCTEALYMAQRVHVDSDEVIKEVILQQKRCVPMRPEFTEGFFTSPCRFGFVRPADRQPMSGERRKASKDKKVKFVSDKGKNSCDKCLQYHEKIFDIDDPNKPKLPIHPNCRCKYEEIENPQIEKIKARIQQIANQTREYAQQLLRKVSEVSADAEKLIQAASHAKGKVESALLAAKISALIITIQCLLWSVNKINPAITEIQNVLQRFGMKMTGFGEEAISLAKAPADLTAALKRLHHSRLLDHDQQQKNLPNSPEEATKRGFVKAPDSQNRYHRNKGQKGNVKYYHPITGQEVIFNANGKFVTDPENIGTKNYGADIKDFWGIAEHTFYDILPYWIWGNSENDTTPLWDRILGSGK